MKHLAHSTFLFALVHLSTTAVAQQNPGLLPDIVEEPPRHLSIQNDHQRESLRFSTTHWNQGAGPLQIRGGDQVNACTIDGNITQCTFALQEILDAGGAVVDTQAAGVTLFHPEHNHWHQSDVALFELHVGTPEGPLALDGTGNTIQGVKITFCLIDNDKSQLVGANSTREYFECNSDLQGISPGWGDEYHHSTHGQELDITGLESGIYVLTHDADPQNKWRESDDTNNRAWVRFRLLRQGPNPKIAVLDESPCDTLPNVGPGESACGNTSNK